MNLLNVHVCSLYVCFKPPGPAKIIYIIIFLSISVNLWNTCLLYVRFPALWQFECYSLPLVTPHDVNTCCIYISRCQYMIYTFPGVNTRYIHFPDVSTTCCLHDTNMDYYILWRQNLLLIPWCQLLLFPWCQQVLFFLYKIYAPFHNFSLIYYVT